MNFPSCISIYILCIWEGSLCFCVWHISESGKERKKSNSQWVSSFRFATNCIRASFENMKFSYIPWCWQKRLSELLSALAGIAGTLRRRQNGWGQRGPCSQLLCLPPSHLTLEIAEPLWALVPSVKWRWSYLPPQRVNEWQKLTNVVTQQTFLLPSNSMLGIIFHFISKILRTNVSDKLC